MKCTSILSVALALVTGLVAAYFWYRSAKVPLVSDMPDAMTHDGKPISRVDAYGDSETLHGTKRGVEKAAALNGIAALWTAASVVLSALSSIAASLG